jgi:hypothetical protein
MLPLPEKVRKNWAVMGYLFGLVRQIDPDLKFMVDTFTLVGFLWFAKRFFCFTGQIFSGEDRSVRYDSCCSQLKSAVGKK